MLDDYWLSIVLSLIGEDLDGEANTVTGVVVNVRARGSRIQIWTRDSTNVDRVNALGSKIASVLGLFSGVGVALDFSVSLPILFPFVRLMVL